MLIHMETEGKHEVKSRSSAHHKDTEGDLHGSHQGVFITKQITFIQSNTTQVYFKWLPLHVRLIRFLYRLME